MFHLKTEHIIVLYCVSFFQLNAAAPGYEYLQFRLPEYRSKIIIRLEVY